MPQWEYLDAQVEAGRWLIHGYAEDLVSIEKVVRDMLNASRIPARTERNGDMMLIVYVQIPPFLIANVLGVHRWEMVGVVNLGTAINYCFKRPVPSQPTSSARS